MKELTADEAHLSNGDVLPYGLAVWSTGVGPTSFTTGLPFAKTARGRIAVDGEMRVLQHIDPEKAQGTEVQKPSDVSKQGMLWWHAKLNRTQCNLRYLFVTSACESLLWSPV